MPHATHHRPPTRAHPPIHLCPYPRPRHAQPHYNYNPRGNQSINQRSSQSHTRARRRSRSQHCHRGQQIRPAAHIRTLTLTSRPTRNQSINQRSSQSHTRARRSHIPAPPLRTANPASWSDAGLGGCKWVTAAPSMRKQNQDLRIHTQRDTTGPEYFEQRGREPRREG